MDHLTQLQRSMEEMKAMFVTRMAAFESAGHNSDTSDTVVSTSDDYQSFKCFIWSAVKALQDQMGLVLRTLEEQEMRARSSILLVHGVPETKDEDVMGLVTSICQRDLQMIVYVFCLMAIVTPSLSRPYDPEDDGLKSVLPSSGEFEAFYPREAHGIPNGSSRPAHGHGSFYKHRNPALVDVKNAAAYGFRFDGMRRFNFDEE